MQKEIEKLATAIKNYEEVLEEVSRVLFKDEEVLPKLVRKNQVACQIGPVSQDK